MQLEKKEIHKDLIVVGAGMPGLVAAIQASRLGLDVGLINDRGYLGGNAGAEIRIHVSGSDGEQEFNFYSREGGILEEIRLENLYRNPQGNPYIWDSVLRDFVYKEKNIELFLETSIDEIKMKSEKEIERIAGTQQDSETRYYFHADFFVDDTGDGTIGSLAGADFRIGREGKQEFGEKIAPDKPDDFVIPSTMTFVAKDVGEPVQYVPPDFALDLTKTDVLKNRIIPQDSFYRSQWYYEIGGTLDQTKDVREIIDKHHSLVYGIWDYIKNSGKYNSENYDLEYVSCIPGKRESRRLTGDYTLREMDVVEQNEFEDAVGHGGWSVDLHAIKGFFDTAPENYWMYLKGIYQIPYRTGYSQNIDNLFFAGRCMSTTHVAFGSTRVIATLCTLGQAIGAAAYLCKEHDLTPRGVYENKIKDLQQLLLREDQYVVGAKNTDEEDKARRASITASSVRTCELTKSDELLRSDTDLGLIVPIRKTVKTISLLVKSDEETTLTFTVYKPDKKYNFSPDEKIAEGEIEVKSSQELCWIELPVDAEVSEDKLFVIIKGNEKIQFGAAQYSLPGVLSLYRYPNEEERILDIFTMEPKTHLWKKINRIDNGRPKFTMRTDVNIFNLCFKIDPVQDVFGPDNIKNGHARPFGLPNVWVSDGMDKSEWIEIEFDQPQSVSSLILYFDSNLDCEIFNIGRRIGMNTMPAIVKDYRVLFQHQNQFRKITEVRDNHQRLNKLQFKTVETDKIRIEFLATNGSPDVHLFDVRVY